MKKEKKKAAISNLSFGKVLGAGVVFGIISQVIHTAGAALSMKYYTIPDYFPVWSKIMMPTAGPPPTEFYYYSISFAVITGILLSLVYSIVKIAIYPIKPQYKRGAFYGVLLFLIAGVPFSLSLYLLINLPTALIWLWAVEQLLIYVIGGMAIARINP